MGCDIHLYSESKVNGQWVCDTEASKEWLEEDQVWYLDYSRTGSRNYWLFGLLAEVRTRWPYSFHVRGLPEDLSETLRQQHEQWGSDAHNASHLSVLELQEKSLELLLMTDADPDAHTNGGYLRELINGLPPSKGDAQRIVFWFDN